MRNIVSHIWAYAEADPDRVAIRSPRQITYGELRNKNQRIAGAIKDKGLRPLDRVVFIAPTIPEFPEYYYGLLAAGMTITTMNVMSTEAEIDYVVDDSGATLVIAWHENAKAAEVVAKRRNVQFWKIEPNMVIDSAPATAAYEYQSDDTAIILYTSGTSGRPKGVELTMGNLTSAVACFELGVNLSESDRFGTALPLFHVFGQAVCMNTSLALGASLSLLAPFDSVAMIELIKTEKLTIVSGVPTMWNAMLHVDQDFEPGAFSSLRVATSGGASLPLDVIRAFESRFECTILEGYGLTETTGAATFNDINREQRPGSVGPALLNAEIQVRGENGHVLSAGEVGEIFIRGPVVMKSYWNRVEDTEKALHDGWLRSGDLGSIDSDGYLTIVDRVKDLVIRGGYNVYPREVEEVLYQHPDIVEAAVIGIPDDYYGEEIAAVVVLRAKANLNAEEIRSWTKKRLSAYKVPRIYSFVDALPKGSTGKILKRDIDRSKIARPPAHTD